MVSIVILIRQVYSCLYKALIPKEKHVPGNHREEIRDGKKISNSTIEGAFSLFKRGLIGQHHQLSPWHLDRYLHEFCFRFNRRGCNLGYSA
jgi:hypothetical protein